MKEERFPHTRKSLHCWGRGEGGDQGRGKLRCQGGECSNKAAEDKAERFLHRGSPATHHPERLVCSPAGAAGGWELRLGLWRSDPRERTGVGCVNTA